MKKYFLIILFFAGVVFSQGLSDFRLEKPSLSKAGSENPASNSITDILIDDDNTIWIATSRGLSKSEDHGKSWTNYYGTEDFGTLGVPALGYNDGVIWASLSGIKETDGSTVNVGEGLIYSEDNGETWNRIEQPVDDPGDSSVVYGINTLRALPVTVKEQNLIYDIAFSKEKIWIATFAGGLRSSDDMGVTWKRVPLPPDYLDEINPNDTLSFTLQPQAGKFGPESNLNHRLFSIASDGDEKIYAGTANGINISEDNGLSWKKYNHQNQDESISGNFVVALEYDSLSGSIWGATWRAEDQDEFYGVSYSLNDGESWQTALYGERGHNFAFSRGEVIAATDNGLFASRNSGNEWLSPNVIADDQKSIAILRNQFYSAGVQDSAGVEIVWGGSAGEGLAKMISKNGIWDGDWNILLASAPLENAEDTYAFPNPFSPDDGFTRIKYSLNSSTDDVTIRILDFDMNLVRTLIQKAPRNAGDEIFEIWDGRDDSGNYVPNGVYFYRIDAGSGDPLFGKIMVLM